MRRFKIFYKFLIVLLFISVVPLLITGYRLIDINRLGLQDIILELHTKQATTISKEIEAYMENLTGKIKFVIFSHGEGVIDWSLTQRILRSMIASSEDFLTISTVDIKGKEITKVFHPSLEGKVKIELRSEDETFIRSRETGAFAVSRLYYTDNIPRLNIVYPFTESLFLYIEVSLEKLLNSVKDARIMKTGFAYIVNENGEIIMHPDISKGINFVSVIERPIVQDVLSRQLVGSTEYTTEEGKKVVGAYAPVGALNWGVIVVQDKDEAYLSAHLMRKNAFILLIVMVIISSAIGYLLTRTLTMPILKLTSAARSVASGNFDMKVISDWLKKVKIKDEMAELASTFIIMTQQLKRYTDMQADKMNAILFSIADGIIMTDYSGKIILSNRRVKELLNIDVSEGLDGRNIQDIIKRDEISLSLREAREKKENIIKEIDLTSGKDIKFIRSDTSIVSHLESGVSLGTVTVIRDITLEKQLDQLKEDFIHSITHDLRSPMTSIRGFLEFLLDGSAGEINEQQKEFLEIIDKSSSRLLAMINDILDVAKLETGTMPMKMETVNFLDIINEAIRSIESQAKKDNIAMSIIKKNKIKEIDADRDLILRVVINLLGNALKFTPSGGEIKIIIEDTGDKIEVAVSDTGEGMPQDMCEKIFDKFQQISGSSGKRKGTGLGLTITKYIVESHKGEIRAESQLGKGATFTFFIPRLIENQQVATL